MLISLLVIALFTQTKPYLKDSDDLLAMEAQWAAAQWEAAQWETAQWETAQRDAAQR